jgi:hypothetical protein
MKNLILTIALAIIFCSCRKDNVNPVSKDATLHIEYSATHTTFSGNPYISKVTIFFSGKSPVSVYSNVDKYNIISTDVSVQGGQRVTITGAVVDSTGSCTCNGLPPTMALTYNGKALSTTVTNGVAQYVGTLEFIK